MPITGQGPRLWLRRERRNARRIITHPAVWIVKDGSHQESTRCSLDDRRAAESFLAQYIARKHVRAVGKTSSRDPGAIPIADVIGLYAARIAGKHSRPKETAARLKQLLTFFGTHTLSAIDEDLCADYVAHRGAMTAARRELEDLRAAIKYHHKKGLCAEVVSVTLPDKSGPRLRWITRAEAAQFVRHCWRYREVQKGRATGRFSRRHVAKFVLVGLYTGRRATAICQASFERRADRGWIDLKHGLFHARPGLKITKKLQPTIRLPSRLLAHLRRWHKQGHVHVVEWNGESIVRINKAFREAVFDAGLSNDVTPHTLRHTAATWGMQRRADTWQLAGYLGMSVETLIAIYGHHHPDHQKDAWSVFDRPGNAGA